MAMLHEEALNRLCFVCGQFVNESLIYEANKYLESLGNAFNRMFMVVDGVTAKFLCHSCYRTTTHIEKGDNLSTSKCPIEWKEHGNNCYTCSLYGKKKVGGRKKKVC